VTESHTWRTDCSRHSLLEINSKADAPEASVTIIDTNPAKLSSFYGKNI
jgi:hypothetical protein